MIWAIRKGEKVKAQPGLNGFCNVCNEKLIPKCGLIKIWHWAHKMNKDCDNWYEPETDWHINWKNEFPKEQQEFVIGKHRADIKTNLKVIELQNSSISPEEINERENFYGEMIWLINGDTLCRGLELRKKKGDILTFRWKHPQKSWWFAKKEIYIDLNFIPLKWMTKVKINNFTEKQKEFWKDFADKIFHIKKIYPNIPCGGWGQIITKKEFLKKYQT